MNKDKLKWYWWRLTGYREFSKLMHASMAISHNALTPIGIKRMNELAQIEDRLYKNAFYRKSSLAIENGIG